MQSELPAIQARLDQVSERTVHVTVPVTVAYRLDGMEEITRKVLARLGCDNCHSGWDIRFRMVRDFVVNEKLDVHAATPIEIP